MSAEERAFVDTNILVYAHDTTAGAKRDAAVALVERLWDSGNGCVSIQALQELFVTLTRRLPRPLDPEAAKDVVEDFERWTVHAPASEDVLAAIDLHGHHRISFWNAMIVRSAWAEKSYVLPRGAATIRDDAVETSPFGLLSSTEAEYYRQRGRTLVGERGT